VIALGTNDAADIAVGSNTGAAARITKMMAAIGHQPVLWVDTVSILPSGPYAAANMLRWNQALTQACRTYPNLRIYDWAAFATRSLFTTDGIHYTTPGSVVRAAGIAHGLAAAFPQTGRSAGCIVR
jgi:lysophospholipase L1-like esterase